MIGRIDIYPTTEGLIRASAGLIASVLTASVQFCGSAMIALSGGSTPRSVYALLGSESWRTRIPWRKVQVFWGDERCVPPTHPESNFQMVNEALLRHINVPPENIHRIAAERNPADAARAYEEELRQTIHVQANDTPQFDLVLLGLGDDGHTASLFSGTSALHEQEKLVTEVYVEKLSVHRITLTVPLINNARNIFFLVSGKSKAAILREVLQGNSIQYPAQYVRPNGGELQWLVDQDAASLLETVSQQ